VGLWLQRRCVCVCVGRGFRFIISSFRVQQLSWIGWWILFAQFGSAQSSWIGLGRMGYMCAVEGSLQKYFFGVVWCTLLTRGCARKLCVMCTLGTHRDLVPHCSVSRDLMANVWAGEGGGWGSARLILFRSFPRLCHHRRFVFFS